MFPGAYSGRWPHIHFEVYSDVETAVASGPIVKTSQIALPQEACAAVYATSAAVTNIGVSVSPTTATGGTNVTATIASGPGNAADWVGLYPVNDANVGAYVDWKYLNGTRTVPGTGLTRIPLRELEIRDTQCVAFGW